MRKTVLDLGSTSAIFPEHEAIGIFDD